MNSGIWNLGSGIHFRMWLSSKGPSYEIRLPRLNAILDQCQNRIDQDSDVIQSAVAATLQPAHALRVRFDFGRRPEFKASEIPLLEGFEDCPHAIANSHLGQNI
jgi:hypothetical protein